MAKVKWEERLRRIVSRYDEVIEVGEDDGRDGILFRRVKKFVEQLNISDRDKVTGNVVMGEYNKSRLIPEQHLYEALRKQRLKMPPPDRFPC